METFFDEVFAPGFAYEFVKITKIYAYPKSYFRHKKIRCYLTHGAPSIPVKTIYLNSVKLRLVLGVFTFVFGGEEIGKTQNSFGQSLLFRIRKGRNILV